MTHMDRQKRRWANESDCAESSELLEQQGRTHLRVQGRGDHLVIYSEDEGEKVSRARLTRLSPTQYQLGVADHRGRWEPTPFTGTIPELFQLLSEQFGWVLADY